MKPHKHAELIKARAEGAEVEVPIEGVWRASNIPWWCDNDSHQIKPTVFRINGVECPRPTFSDFGGGGWVSLGLSSGNKKFYYFSNQEQADQVFAALLAPFEEIQK